VKTLQSNAGRRVQYTHIGEESFLGVAASAHAVTSIDRHAIKWRSW
jgi:hypothetical protein